MPTQRPIPTRFSTLLTFHKEAGTRADGTTGRAWSDANLGEATKAVPGGLSANTIRNWRTGRIVPDDIVALCAALFGGSLRHAEARAEFEAAWREARGVISPPAPTPPDPPGPLSNISIPVPHHFLGRDAALAAIHAALQTSPRPVAITALHGMRGVGKTVLAAAYAQRHAETYRATWWLPAETPDTLRPALAALGTRLGWAPPDMKENEALPLTLGRLQREGEAILLIYDNASDAAAIAPYLPNGGAARILVTSNNPAWRTLAEPVEIETWPPTIGADYLIARSGHTTERAAAESLSETLGGLPLAHEMAAAFCEETGTTLAAYAARFADTPLPLLDDAAHAPGTYYGGTTVSRAFTLAIEQATVRHPAAGHLLAYAALLAPEPTPIFFFTEGCEHLGEPLATALAGLSLEYAVAALRAFALVARASIPDERDPALTTDSLRVHRLVRQVAIAKIAAGGAADIRSTLLAAAVAVYPKGVFNTPSVWPRARRLDALCLALLSETDTSLSSAARATAALLNNIASYRHGAEADYTAALPLFRRALSIQQQSLGTDHPDTAASLNNLARLLHTQGDLPAARLLYERALAIQEHTLGPEHLDTALSMNNLAFLMRAQGDLHAAQPLYERALAVRELALGPDHPGTAESLNDLAMLLQAKGELTAALPLFHRALAIRARRLGPNHPDTGKSLNNLALLLQEQGQLPDARPLFERALTIWEQVFGPDHPDVAIGLANLARLLHAQGDLFAAQSLFERAIAIAERRLGSGHIATARFRRNLGLLLLALSDPPRAVTEAEAALTAHEAALGPTHPWTLDSARTAAEAYDALNRFDEAATLRQRLNLRSS